jgi:hypothetical protein
MSSFVVSSRALYCAFSSEQSEAPEPLRALDRCLDPHIRRIAACVEKGGQKLFILSGIGGLISSDERIYHHDHKLAVEEVPLLSLMIFQQLSEFDPEEVYLFIKSGSDTILYRNAVKFAAENLLIQVVVLDPSELDYD